MGWEDAPIVQAAPQAAPWESAPIVQAAPRRTANGVFDAIEAGWQGSATGLALRGKLPDVVLDAQHSKWYEKAAATVSQVVAEIPEMIPGAIGGAAAGTAMGGPVGTILGSGAGMFAVPAAIRESLIQAYSKGDVASTADFLTRAAIVLKTTGKEAVVGAATMGAGAAVARGVGAAIAPAIGESIAVPTAQRIIGAAGTTAELGTMVVTPALLEGKLPEPEDFVNAAIVIGGMKGAGAAAKRIAKIYEKTGIPPEQVVADAKGDPALAKELQGLGAQPTAPAKGQPLVADVFHGSPKANIRSFDMAAQPTGRVKAADSDGVIWLAADKGYAAEYSAGATLANPAPIKQFGAKPGAVYDVRVQMRNPFVVDDVIGMTEMDRKAAIDYARASGHDGVVLRHVTKTDGEGAPVAWNDRMNEYAVFRPEQATILNPSRDAGIPAAYAEAARAENARNAVPGGKAATVAASPFADIPQLPGEPAKPTHVNYNYLNSADDVKGALSRLSQVYEAEIQGQRRGTVGWEQTSSEAAQMLTETLGGKDATLLMPREPGTAAGAAELLARKQMVVGAAEDMAAKAKEIAALGTNASAEQTAAFLGSIERAAMIQSEFLGARAEAGRALNILKYTAVDAERAKMIQDVINMYGKDPATLAKMIAEIDTPAGMLKMAREMTKATTWEKVVEAWKAGILSGPYTHTANILGNSTFAALRVPIDTIAAGLGAFRGGPDRVTAVEPLARLTGLLQGTADGAKVALNVLKTGDVDMGKAEQHRKAIEGTKGEIIRLPFRALSAEDAMFRTMSERAEAYTLAVREAAKEGHNLNTREFRERVAQMVENPTPEMADTIRVAGERYTFNTPMGNAGNALQQFVKAWHLEWAVPFIRTPGNILKELARMSPAAPLVKEWRADIAKGGAAADKATAEVLLGGAIAASVASFAFNGDISGAGDPDPAKKRVAAAAGWQPYSIKVDGKWYSYQRLQPVGTLMGLAADMAEVWEHMTPEESDKVTKMLGVAFANGITNQTFLQGITNIVNAMSDPNRFGPKFVQNLAASTVPAIAGQTAGMQDPFLREIDSVLDAVKNRVPGLRQTLLPKRDIFGEAIQNKDRVADVLPITVTEQSKDLVRTEAARLKVGVAKAPDALELPAGGDKKLGKVKLTPEQQDVFATVSGRIAYDALQPIVTSGAWPGLPDMVKRRIYETTFNRARKVGAAEALPPDQRMAESQRISEEIARRLGQ